MHIFSRILFRKDIRDNIIDMIDSSCEMIVDTYRQEIDSHKVNKEALQNEIRTTLNINDVEHFNNSNRLLDELTEKAHKIYEEKEKEIGEPIRELERVVLLKVVDDKWMDHIDNMDELKMVLVFVHMVKKTQLFNIGLKVEKCLMKWFLKLS